MIKNEERNIETDEFPEINMEETKKRKKKKRKEIIIILVVLIILIIGILIVGFIILDNMNSTLDKPLIYLYPEQEMEVNVKLGNPENLIHTYPKYESGWNVLAKPNGDLIDLKTRKNLYALYWEGNIKNQSNIKEGFVVKGSDTIKFLEEKLEILGLTEREANEFIIYWLPKLENNKYNYIRFQTIEEIEENMPLNINPTPDTVIRLVMEFKKLNNPIEVTEQVLETPARNGFVAVEWGGTEIL